jgi:hypothetical protein
MPSNLEWQNVPENYRHRWIQIFSNSQEGINLFEPCPMCGQNTLHHYYQYMGEKKSFILNGKNYTGRGDLWEWCSSCRTFERYYAAIPDWWNFDLPMDNSRLVSDPDELEKAININNLQ